MGRSKYVRVIFTVSPRSEILAKLRQTRRSNFLYDFEIYLPVNFSTFAKTHFGFISLMSFWKYPLTRDRHGPFYLLRNVYNSISLDLHPLKNPSLKRSIWQRKMQLKEINNNILCLNKLQNQKKDPQNFEARYENRHFKRAQNHASKYVKKGDIVLILIF